MSRQLPQTPNLEHLKKQAKEMLAQLRRQDPDYQLSQAQHEVAQSYGFSSWPKLKAFVDGEVRKPRHPFDGLWVADLARSKRHSLNLFHEATLRFSIDGDTVSIAHVGVDESGREEKTEHILRPDGSERDAGHGAGYVAVAGWHGPRVLEVAEKKDGQIVGSGRYEVSEDGHTLTVTTTEQTIVFVRN